MKCYYNAEENLIGFSIGNSVQIKVCEEFEIYRVLSDKWELVEEDI